MTAAAIRIDRGSHIYRLSALRCAALARRRSGRRLFGRGPTGVSRGELSLAGHGALDSVARFVRGDERPAPFGIRRGRCGWTCHCDSSATRREPGRRCRRHHRRAGLAHSSFCTGSAMAIGLAQPDGDLRWRADCLRAGRGRDTVARRYRSRLAGIDLVPARQLPRRQPRGMGRVALPDGTADDLRSAAALFARGAAVRVRRAALAPSANSRRRSARTSVDARALLAVLHRVHLLLPRPDSHRLDHADLLDRLRSRQRVVAERIAEGA
jgi:hypothetical protein